MRVPQTAVHRKGPDRPAPEGRSQIAGFTLLELMVVIVIMGAIVTLVTPRFKSIFEVELKSSMRQIAGMIKYCFHESIIRQATIRLNFDITTGAYYPAILVTDPESNVGEFMEAPSSIAQAARLPDNVFFEDILTPRSAEKLDDGETFIMFYSTGYAEKAVIHMRDIAGRQYTLLVRPLNGSVKIFDGYVDFAVLHQTETPYGTATESSAF